MTILPFIAIQAIVPMASGNSSVGARTNVACLLPAVTPLLPARLWHLSADDRSRIHFQQLDAIN